MNRMIRRILAAICALVLFVNVFNGIADEVKANSGYREYTFSDFYIADQDITRKQIYSENVPYGTSLDDVVIKGEITFPEGSSVGSEDIQIGNLCAIGPATDVAFGIWNCQSPGWFGFSSNAAETIIGRKLSLSLTFHQSGNNYDMKIEVDGNDLGTVTLTNGVQLLTWHALVFNAGAGKTVSIKSLSKEPIVYQEYSFGDFHIADQDVTGQQIYSEDVPYGTSLDKIAIKGKVTFPEGSALGSENVQIGNLCVIGPDGGNKIGVWNIQGTSYFGQSGETTKALIENAIELKLSFLQSGDDYNMKIEVDGEDLGTITLTNAVQLLTWHALVFNAGAGKTVVIGEGTPKPPTYTELTFENFGIEDGTYKTGIQTGNIQSDIPSLNGMAITETIAFSDGNSCIRIGGNDAEGYVTPINLFNSGGTLWSWDENGTGHHVQIGTIETNKGVAVRLTFDFIDNDVKVCFYLNGTYATEHIYTDYANELGTKVLVWARGGALAIGDNAEILPEEPIEQKTPQELEYKQIRLADFEMSDGTYSPLHKNGVHHFEMSDRQSLNQTYLDINLIFEQPETISRENSIRFASTDGWGGIQIGVEANQFVIQDALTGIGQTYSLEELQLETFAEMFNLKLGIQLMDAESEGTYHISYDLWVEDVRVEDEGLLENVAGIGNGLGIYTPSGTITMSSPLSIYGDSNTEEKEVLPSNFRKVTFASFGIHNGTYQYNNGKLGAYGEYALSLHKTMFSGQVYFSNVKGGDFRYGGKSNEWCGLWFYNMPDGKLYMQGVEGNTGTYVFKSFVAGIELTDHLFDLKLTTEYIDSDGDGKKDDVKLGVWFEDVLYDNAYIYLKDYAQYLGGYMGVYVDKGEGCIKVTSDTAVELGIDYTLFGYTKQNWREKIGL